MPEIVRMTRRLLMQHWAGGSSIEVEWRAERCADTPILRAYGEIKIWKPAADQTDSEEDDGPKPCGSLSIVKPYLWSGEDLWLALDGENGDYIALGAPILNERTYRDDFTEWCLEEFGVLPGGDPILLIDLEVLPEYRPTIQRISSLAVLEALGAFGSSDSVLVGFTEEKVARSQREICREKGLWQWTATLGAKRWKDVLIAVRPEG